MIPESCRMERDNDHYNVICGDITQAREQQNLDVLKPSTLKLLMAFKLKIAEERIPVEKKERKGK